jgi:hypothetical protein
MKRDGYDPELIHGCHNRTVVIDAHLGERENKQLDVIEAHGLRNVHLYEGEEWIDIREAVGDLTRDFLCLNEVYPKGLLHPEAVHRREHHPPAHGQDARLHHDHRRDEERLRRLLNEHRHWTHPVIHETLVDLLMIQKKIHRGVFAVMDGTFAGDGPGPRCMIPHVKNVMLASADQVAIDAVAAKLMGFDPMEIKFIRWRTSGARLRRPARDRDRRRRRRGRRELGLRRAVQEDDLRQPDAAQDLLGPAEVADRVVAEDLARAVGVHGQRPLPRQLLVSRPRRREGRPHPRHLHRRGPGDQRPSSKGYFPVSRSNSCAPIRTTNR